MKLLVDMNLTPRWVPALREVGFEAVHWSEVGPRNAPDWELMQWAAKHGYVVLTRDLDFGTLLAVTGKALPSVVQLRTDKAAPEPLLGRLIEALERCKESLATGALVTLDPGRMRLRLLPLDLAPTSTDD